MPLYEKIIDDVLNRKEPGTVGSETMSNIGSFVQDQYEKLPENFRTGLEEGTVNNIQAIQEWNREKREENVWGGVGPLDPLIQAGKAYNAVATPIKEQISIKTGLAPSVVEAGEVVLDVATPFIPITVRKAEDVVNTIFSGSRRLKDWGKRTTGDAQYLFGGGVGQGTGVGGKSLSKHYKDKLTVHERALNPDMIGFDQRALDRRAKIDAQFELNSRTRLPEGPRNIRSGSTETARRAKAAWSLGEEVDPQTIKIFEESNQSILDGYNYRLHGKKINVGKTQGHHKGVVRQIFEASNGLNKKYRLESAKYMQNRIGFELGYHGRNVVPVPERFHPRVHAIINDRISSSQDLFNVEGAAKRLGFPENWQSVLTFEERKPLYNEIADAIRESVDAINTNWEVLLSRSDDLTTYSKEEYLDLMLRHNKLDKKLKEVASPRLMASRKNWDLKDTSTAVLNEILSKSNKKDLTLPWIGKVEPSMASEVQKILRENNGWQYLKEVLLTDQSAATVIKAYPGIELTKKQLNSLDNYSHMLRSRGKSIPPADSTWNFGQDN